MTKLAFSLLALLPATLAFRDTIPIIAWSSHPTSVLNRLAVAHTFDSLLVSDDICSHEAIVIVDQPGLHASDLRNLPPTSHIARSLGASVSSRQLPYITKSTLGDSGDLAALAQAISDRCASRLVSLAPGIGGISWDKSEKAVVVVNLPELIKEGSSRQGSMLEHDQLLASTMASIPYDNHLTLLSSSVWPVTLNKRKAEEDVPVLQLSKAAAKKGGILARYQLLTPGLIVSLLVVLLVLLPVIYFGVNALASIQSPLRMEAPKGFSSTDRKRQ